jgi:hypothetical protein
MTKFVPENLNENFTLFICGGKCTGKTNMVKHIIGKTRSRFDTVTYFAGNNSVDLHLISSNSLSVFDEPSPQVLDVIHNSTEELRRRAISIIVVAQITPINSLSNIDTLICYELCHSASLDFLISNLRSHSVSLPNALKFIGETWSTKFNAVVINRELFCSYLAPEISTYT